MGSDPNVVEMSRQAVPESGNLLTEVHRLVEAYRLQCLWFMREDYLPTTPEEIDRVLSAIETHGDRKAWMQARTLRAWLSQTTNATS